MIPFTVFKSSVEGVIIKGILVTSRGGLQYFFHKKNSSSTTG